MREELVKLLKNSYCPISGKSVSAIVLMNDGKKYKGVNVENPSFSSGLCAEQVAIGRAVADGYKKGEFASIYVMSDGNEFIMPCFLCRQYFVDLFSDNTKIISMNIYGGEKEYTMADLCPYPFRMENINEK